MTQNTKLLDEVATYYAQKLAAHGRTPQGVDWNGADGQIVRFNQLCRIIIGSPQHHFSINDLGCGYGALRAYLHNHYKNADYLGIDVSHEMVEAAQVHNASMKSTRFVASDRPDRVADYGVASGIFNVRQGRSENEWLVYLEATLDVLNATSRLGFAFNCLTSYSDEDRKRPDLYYADPCGLFDVCKRRYSKEVALLHDYGLYEFTVLVRKS